ncbi:hypothetical protein ACFV06_07605 [Streptomyces sp. NPDC059618]|uniref:hypothetical protein n=1 Tax=Streptomyces sp. NPDC059618 TaxID=3346887 RepID=UPI003697D66D
MTNQHHPAVFATPVRRRRQADKPQRGYWCECWTRRLDDEQPPMLFGSYDAYTEVEANSWVSTILRTISPALDRTPRRKRGDNSTTIGSTPDEP